MVMAGVDAMAMAMAIKMWNRKGTRCEMRFFILHGSSGTTRRARPFVIRGNRKHPIEYDRCQCYQ